MSTLDVTTHAGSSPASAFSPTAIATEDLSRTSRPIGRDLVRPVLVATDGSRAGGAALRVATVLSRRDGCRIEALLVEEPPLPGVSGVCIDAEALREEPIPRSTQLGRIRAQLRALIAERPCNLHIDFGSPPSVIARTARDCEAGVIVMGLSKHHPVRRLFGSETVARTLRHVDRPVLAVSATARGLPHVAVVAVDFSESSLRAARAVAELLESPATLHLVHVFPAVSPSTGDAADLRAVYEAGVDAELERLASELGEHGATAERAILTGHIAEAVLEHARRVGADLVACGSHGRGVVQRLLLGTVPQQLLRASEVSVLVAPPRTDDVS